MEREQVMQLLVEEIMTNQRIRPSHHYPYTSKGEEQKCGDALAATSPPLAKRSPVEAKAGDSRRSPTRRFASIGETFANGGERWPPGRRACHVFAPTGLASPSLAKSSPMRAMFPPHRHVDLGTFLPPSANHP
ncbi:hypothetical protein R1flu_023608 [Riccia fluitans]|uniref:Uncharacterized protein n=1 Tax=Riccia fluitans TaxID=41844 RepID=A0ABD1XSK3_9MARC